MKNKVHNLILFEGFVFLLLLLVPVISKAACTNVPMSGDYTVSSSCTFANTVDGVDEGGITVNSGVTLTVNAGQTIVWSPGHSIVINGAIAIANGGQLKQTYLWLVDADNDGRPSSLTMYAQDTQPTNGKRRKDFTNFTYVSDIIADCNDSNSYIYRNKTVGTDTDHDGYIAGSSTSSQCVGNSTSINGRTYYKDSSGNYTKLYSSQVVGYSDCNDSNSSKWVLKYKDNDGDNYCASSTQYCVGNDSGYTSSCSSYSDCCDSDSDVHPGQTNYFKTANACGNFDYNCDGSATSDPTWIKWGVCASTSCTSNCCGETQFSSSDCGQQFSWACKTGHVKSCTGGWNWKCGDCECLCDYTYSNYKVPCH